MSAFDEVQKRGQNQPIKVNSNGGAELICRGGGGGNMQVKTRRTGCTLAVGQ